MLQSNWHSSDHCLHRAQEEVRKAVGAPLVWLRVHHLEAAIEWVERGRQLGGTGLWDQLEAPPAPLPLAANDTAPAVSPGLTG